MSRTAITRGSLYNGSITMALIHFILSLLAVLLGIYIMKEFTLVETAACLFLLLAVIGIVASVCMILGLYMRSSVLALVAFVVAIIEALCFIVLFGLYFFEAFEKSKTIMVGDQNFAMPILSMQIFLSLYFTFAYSRCFRFLFPVQEHSQA